MREERKEFYSGDCIMSKMSGFSPRLWAFFDKLYTEYLKKANAKNEKANKSIELFEQEEKDNRSEIEKYTGRLYKDGISTVYNVNDGKVEILLLSTYYGKTIKVTLENGEIKATIDGHTLEEWEDMKEELDDEIKTLTTVRNNNQYELDHTLLFGRLSLKRAVSSFNSDIKALSDRRNDIIFKTIVLKKCMKYIESEEFLQFIFRIKDNEVLQKCICRLIDSLIDNDEFDSELMEEVYSELNIKKEDLEKIIREIQKNADKLKIVNCNDNCLIAHIVRWFNNKAKDIDTSLENTKTIQEDDTIKRTRRFKVKRYL